MHHLLEKLRQPVLLWLKSEYNYEAINIHLKSLMLLVRYSVEGRKEHCSILLQMSKRKKLFVRCDDSEKDSLFLFTKDLIEDVNYN